MSKTIREWFEELPEPYRTQATANASKDGMLEGEAESLPHALTGAFQWEESPEGHDYWDALLLRAVSGESLGGTPDLATLVRAYFEAKDTMPQADVDVAEKALREAVGL